MTLSFLSPASTVTMMMSILVLLLGSSLPPTQTGMSPHLPPTGFITFAKAENTCGASSTMQSSTLYNGMSYIDLSIPSSAGSNNNGRGLQMKFEMFVEASSSSSSCPNGVTALLMNDANYNKFVNKEEFEYLADYAFFNTWCSNPGWFTLPDGSETYHMVIGTNMLGQESTCTSTVFGEVWWEDVTPQPTLPQRYTPTPQGGNDSGDNGDSTTTTTTGTTTTTTTTTTDHVSVTIILVSILGSLALVGCCVGLIAKMIIDKKRREGEAERASFEQHGEGQGQGLAMPLAPNGDGGMLADSPTVNCPNHYNGSPTPSAAAAPSPSASSSQILMATIPNRVKPSRNCWITFLYVINIMELVFFVVLLGIVMHAIVNAKQQEEKDATASSHYAKHLFSFSVEYIEVKILVRIAVALGIIAMSLSLAVAALKSRNRCTILLYLIFAAATSTILFYALSVALSVAEILTPNAKIGLSLIFVVAIANLLTPISLLCSCCFCRDDVDVYETVGNQSLVVVQAPAPQPQQYHCPPPPQYVHQQHQQYPVQQMPPPPPPPSPPQMYPPAQQPQQPTRGDASSTGSQPVEPQEVV